MKTLQINTKAGPDKLLHFDVEVDVPNAEYEVLVVVHPRLNGEAQAAADKSWHEALDQLAGSITDPTFVRHAQGQREQRLDLE